MWMRETARQSNRPEGFTKKSAWTSNFPPKTLSWIDWNSSAEQELHWLKSRLNLTFVLQFRPQTETEPNRTSELCWHSEAFTRAYSNTWNTLAVPSFSCLSFSGANLSLSIKYSNSRICNEVCPKFLIYKFAFLIFYRRKAPGGCTAKRSEGAPRITYEEYDIDVK